MAKRSPFNSPNLPRRQHEVGWLKEFLKPLENHYNLQPSSKTLTNKRAFSPVSDFKRSLVYRVTEQLAEEHKDKSREKKKNVREAEEDLQRLLKGNVDLENFKKQWQSYVRASSMKSDREKSGSMWTIEMLERYIEPKDIVLVLNKPDSRFDLTDETLQKIFERVDLANKALCGREETVDELNKPNFQSNSTEFDARMILDAILQPLCVDKGLTVRPEQTIKSDELPNNRYDYIMYCNGDYPIGVVEAKRQGCMKDDSVAQLLVQLLLLASEEPNSLYFGVLSDAHQFVFVGVSKQNVLFFQTKENQLEITTVKSDHDVRSIVRKISWLIDLAIQSRESPGRIKRVLAQVAALKIRG